MRQHNIKIQKRNAFTMIELVLVIVVIGILAALSITRMDRDLRQEAADNILSDIRYTQHLALTDDKHRFSRSQWERAYWHIAFGPCSDTTANGVIYYRIGSNISYNDVDGNQFFDENESAIDPANGRRMYWRNTKPCPNGDPTQTSSDRIFITDKYGITGVTSAGGCSSARHIAFDHYGRPHHGSADDDGFANSEKPLLYGYMTDDCVFTFSFDAASGIDPFDIQINRETGYAWIVDQNAS